MSRGVDNVAAVLDGRVILAELQKAGCADGDLDYEAVVAELAKGTLPSWVLLPSRRTTGSRVVSRRQRKLVDELVRIARAPYLLDEPPPPPSVPWQRLARDLQRTAGRTLDLVFARWEQFSEGGYWVCEITMDGGVRGSFDFTDDDDDPESSLAALADYLCEGWLHEEVWGGWPMCVRHPGRPMWATVNGAGLAVWRCEADPSDEAVIGSVGE